jgi:hypothetical protein
MFPDYPISENHIIPHPKVFFSAWGIRAKQSVQIEEIIEMRKNIIENII